MINFGALICVIAHCQPVTPLPVKTGSTSQNLKINDDSPIPSAPMAPTVSSVPEETLSSGTVEQNNNQTEIDSVISTVTRSHNAQTNSTQAPPDITPKAVTMPKTFDPKEIIGFATPILVHNLGRANMIRKESQIEVWQYQFVNCVVDFFFYPINEGSSQLILKTWDMRNTIMGGRLDRSSCRDEINLYHQKLISNS